MSGQCSADLLWMLTRSNSSFLVKRDCGRIQFSTEKYNLTAQNSFKFQGIANGKAVDISQYYTDADKEKKNPKGITLCTKSPKGINAPCKLDKPTVCAKDMRREFKRVARCITAHVSKERPDLVKPALARWTKYHRALKRIGAKSKK
eukprot:CAMPEP_0179430212 /NCGR_PEP_ID=MMETSP0799-20121207/15417_1 /TAXON_ID=46947 /ORGANISM="Geminigera cryophila, Strain CCMP2564" /LENGTH=146 /DNA_ID=CAMNT_0021206547 /DNA_START=982 /DNA_END=1422 /DNA_ORIENTATION=+